MIWVPAFLLLAATFTTVLIVAVHRLSPTRDRLDAQAPTPQKEAP